MITLQKIPFKLIRTTSYTIQRTGVGVLESGVWTKPTVTPIVIEAIVTPYIKRDVIEVLPENLRKRKVIRIFSNIELKEYMNKPNTETDSITYNGEVYKVFRLGSWVNVSGFTGYEAYAVRAEYKELGV